MHSPPVGPPTGPLSHATLVVADAAPLLAAYGALGLQLLRQGRVSTHQAQAWGPAAWALAGRSFFELAPPGAPTLLRLIEVPGSPIRPTRFHHGWLALEILVADVDALQAPALAAGFMVLGPPADLEMSPHLRAMQLQGLAGEMLYLTQVKAPVPPFDLPLSAELPAGQVLGPLFIAVMAVPSRAAAVQACETQLGLLPSATLQFETKVTVLNRALGRELGARWPLATVTLAGRCLFEIDEVVHAAVSTPADAAQLPAGLAWVSAHSPQTDAASAALLQLAPGAWFEHLPAAQPQPVLASGFGS